MFKSLVPKEEKYFQYFNELIAYVVEMAQLTKELFSAVPYNFETLQKIKSLEKRCDEGEDKIIKKLNKTFLTPFDREDILALTKRVESISDSLNSMVVRLDILNVTMEVESASRMTEIIYLQTKELQSAINGLKDRENVVNQCKAVKDLEQEADIIYHDTIKKLFSDGHDVLTLIKKKEIIDLLEKTIDKCQVVANIILTIFIKNS